MLTKKSFARLIRICTGTFGTGKDEHFSQHESFTRLEKFTHFWMLVWHSFVRNRCPIRASALSFTTLLALIPMLVVCMSISSALLKTQSEQQIKSFVERFIEHFVPDAPKPTEAETSQPDGADTGAETNTPSVVVTIDPALTNAPSDTALVGSSRVDLQACKLEYSIVSPK